MDVYFPRAIDSLGVVDPVFEIRDCRSCDGFARGNPITTEETAGWSDLSKLVSPQRSSTDR